ncbi:hypothetical protein OG906_43510 (plasmid) [Streptomyces sp. NBC_01426]|uniref:hypothetical protein n=1 Tax=Streptomyces sp. NBC_01426 TaxID=2975866 RepID=UPI002E310491|nr:hypothetical protein [Streptomyces sp. NBC_01426]
MDKSEIRRLDRLIDTATRKLAGVEGRESWALSGRDQATLGRHVASIVYNGVRGQRPTPKADRGIELIWQNANAQLRAEIAAAQTAKAELLHQAAKAKAEKKSSGWW